MTPSWAWYQDMVNELYQGLIGVLIDQLAVAPILAPYTPSVNLMIGDITIDGSGSLQMVEFDIGLPFTTGIDPATGQFKGIVEMPAGGWTWEYDGAAPAPPVTVYGYALVDTGAPQLYAVLDPLQTPIVLSQPALLVLGQMSFLVRIPPID